MYARPPRFFANPKCRFKRLKSVRGFTLIEMLIALGISVMAVLAFSGAIQVVMNSDFFVQGTVTRNELARILKNAVMDHRSFKKTVEHDVKLTAIVANDYSTSGPISTNVFYDFSIYDFSDMKLSGPLDVPGDPPAYYMIDGSHCPAGVVAGQGSCAFRVTSRFMVEGPADRGSLDRMVPVASLPVVGYTTSPNLPLSTPCLRAEFIMVSFQIEFANKPGIIERKPTRVSVLISLDDLGF